MIKKYFAEMVDFNRDGSISTRFYTDLYGDLNELWSMLPSGECIIHCSEIFSEKNIDKENLLEEYVNSPECYILAEYHVGRWLKYRRGDWYKEEKEFWICSDDELMKKLIVESGSNYLLDNEPSWYVRKQGGDDCFFSGNMKINNEDLLMVYYNYKNEKIHFLQVEDKYVLLNRTRSYGLSVIRSYEDWEDIFEDLADDFGRLEYVNPDISVLKEDVEDYPYLFAALDEEGAVEW